MDAPYARHHAGAGSGVRAQSNGVCMNAELCPESISEDQPAATIERAFYSSLAKAQAGFAAVKRDKTVTVRTKAGGTYSFSYAPLEAILKATLPALNKEGFALAQHVEGDHLVTTLYHAHGALAGSVKIMVVDQGPQAYGSALTYARRYGVTLLLGICADDDDDGNAAEGNEVEHHDEFPRDVLSPQKRDIYLPRCAQALTDRNAQAFKDLVNELNEGERRGLWSFFSTKQKQAAREILQANGESEAGARG
jgi:hypothetical protein